MIKKGSATLVVIVTSIVFLIYSVSTYADVRQMKELQQVCLEEILTMYKNDYATIEESIE